MLYTIYHEIKQGRETAPERGSMVYGVFRDGETFKIKKGQVLKETEEGIQVEYDAFEWSYRKEEIGFLVFESLEAASEAVEGMQKISRVSRGRE